jgi:hypothetical protein
MIFISELEFLVYWTRVLIVHVQRRPTRTLGVTLYDEACNDGFKGKVAVSGFLFDFKTVFLAGVDDTLLQFPSQRF